MKNKILLLLLLPIAIFAQNDYEDATIIINSLREFDVVEPIYNDSLLNIEAKYWAEHLATEVKMGYGIYESRSVNHDISVMRYADVATKHYSEAIWAFLLLSDNQMYYRRKMVNENVKAIGFGHAYVDDQIIVVIKFKVNE